MQKDTHCCKCSSDNLTVETCNIIRFINDSNIYLTIRVPYRKRFKLSILIPLTKYGCLNCGYSWLKVAYDKDLEKLNYIAENMEEFYD